MQIEKVPAQLCVMNVVDAVLTYPQTSLILNPIPGP